MGIVQLFAVLVVIGEERFCFFYFFFSHFVFEPILVESILFAPIARILVATAMNTTRNIKSFRLSIFSAMFFSVLYCFCETHFLPILNFTLNRISVPDKGQSGT